MVPPSLKKTPGGVEISIIAERYCSKYNLEEKSPVKNTGWTDVASETASRDGWVDENVRSTRKQSGAEKILEHWKHRPHVSKRLRSRFLHI